MWLHVLVFGGPSLDLHSGRPRTATYAWPTAPPTLIWVRSAARGSPNGYRDASLGRLRRPSTRDCFARKASPDSYLRQSEAGGAHSSTGIRTARTRRADTAASSLRARYGSVRAGLSRSLDPVVTSRSGPGRCTSPAALQPSTISKPQGVPHLAQRFVQGDRNSPARLSSCLPFRLSNEAVSLSDL